MITFTHFSVFGMTLLLSMAESFVPAPAFSALESSDSYTSTRVTMASNAFEGTVIVCTGPTCTSKGGKKALEVWKDRASAEDSKFTVETIKCVSECAECALGPNVELRAKGDSGPFYPIKNKVQTQENIDAILGL